MVLLVLKKFKIFKKFPRGGGQKILNIPKFQNIPKLGGGEGGSERLGVFPKFYRFFNWTASLMFLML